MIIKSWGDPSDLKKQENKQMKRELENKALVVKYLLRETTEYEASRVEEWLKADKLNRKFYDEINELIQAGSIAGNRADINVDKAWNKLYEQMQAQKKDRIGKTILLRKVNCLDGKLPLPLPSLWRFQFPLPG